jgi:hypothetical protein
VELPAQQMVTVLVAAAQALLAQTQVASMLALAALG